MRFINTRSRAKEIVKHTNKDKRGTKAQERMQVEIIKTRSRTNYVANRKKNEK